MNTKAQELSTAIETVDTKTLPVNPLMILQGAIEKGIDADQLEKLMTLQERWEASQARKAFDAAMAKFQGSCPTIEKTKPVHNKNGSIRYWYAPLDIVLEVIKPHMLDAGLSIRFNTETTGSIITGICTVSHEAGHSEVSYFAAPVDETMLANNTQKMVSANSYARRTCVMNALNLAARHEDDDGYSASPPPSTAEQVAAHKKAKAKRKPQDPATYEQLADIQEYIDVMKEKPETKRTTTQLKYWLKNKDHMTKGDAAEILRRLKDGV